VAIRIGHALDEDVLAALRSGEADVALAFTDPEDPTAIATRLADEEIVMVMPPGTEGFGSVVPMSAFAEVSLISPPVYEHTAVIRRVRAAGLHRPSWSRRPTAYPPCHSYSPASARLYSPALSPDRQWP
jgi:DNA-binding transcriptional LysR family regulator